MEIIVTINESKIIDHSITINGMVENDYLEQLFFIINYNPYNKNLLQLHTSNNNSIFKQITFYEIYTIYDTLNYLANNFDNFYTSSTHRLNY